MQSALRIVSAKALKPSEKANEGINNRFFPALQPVAPKNHNEPVPAVIGGRPAGQTIFFV